MNYESIKDIKKVDNYGMYVNYAEEDQVGYDENGVRNIPAAWVKILYIW